MADWRVERNGKTAVQSEQELREALRRGALSGAEMVRPPGATGWIPLHTLSVFSEEVPVRRSSGQAVDRKMVQGWLLHLVVFGFVVVYVGKGTIPKWAMLWGIGLLAHTLRGLPAAWRIVRDWRAGASPPPRRAARADPPALAALPAPGATDLPTDTPFLVQVHQAVDAVRDLWTGSPHTLGPLPDLDGLTGAAEQLEARHQSLSALHQDEDQFTLEAELEAALGRQQAAPDAVTAAVFGDEATAIADRLAAVDAAIAVADQLAARKRTLLHQLAGLRLAAGQTAATRGGTEPARVAETLIEKTHTLRDALQASAEVDDALVRARKAAAARRARRT